MMSSYNDYDGIPITGKWVVDPGTFTVFIGASSADIRPEASFRITDGLPSRENANLQTSREDPV